MFRAKTDPSAPDAAAARLAPRIAMVMVAKVVVLVVLWMCFVRDQRVAVDAHGTAAAFGLLGAQPGSK